MDIMPASLQRDMQLERQRNGTRDLGHGRSAHDWTDKQGHHHEDTYEGGHMVHGSEIWKDPKGHWNKNFVTHNYKTGHSESNQISWDDNHSQYNRTDRESDGHQAWEVYTNGKSSAFQNLDRNRLGGDSPDCPDTDDPGQDCDQAPSRPC